ncbi:28 kDa heat- and acid-stable phosphoprotein [Drosophila grimshawi]|uniref:GH11454 n=1 Tax=Drosophila grimshawi TaxID=7222 RepID=B4JAG3_DROGR|nr:28 kDa heat- and acid-stable phosphoprotein [Drosophila grimshawi]XP_032592300.1 28 kDa heat- and acid-stable phosphoprotein [Drosophila grimshawi]EDW03834.1 GH11454 [Drosophila grimshawi]
MSRGKYVKQKGRKRHFTMPEELAQKAMKESDLTVNGRKAGRDTDYEDNQQQQQQRGSDVESTDDSEAELEERDAKKGVASLIAIKNPNRVYKKITENLAQIKIDDDVATSGGDDDAVAGAEGGGYFKANARKPEMCRKRVNFELLKQKKKKSVERYEKLQPAENTIKEKSDLARLALIRQQREEAAAKREAVKRAAAEKVPKKLFIRDAKKATETSLKKKCNNLFVDS